MAHGLPSPEDVVPRWQDAWNRADADAIAELFAEDAEFVNVVGLWWHDRRRIRDAHAYGFATVFPGSTIRMSPPRTRRVGGDGAVVQSRWHLTGQVSPTGERADRREGVFTFVLERRRDGWIVVAAQNTDVARGAETRLNTAGAQSAVSYRVSPTTRRAGTGSPTGDVGTGPDLHRRPPDLDV